MMNRDMTISQRVTRAADSCELEKVLATHNYLHAASRSYEEWTTVWSKREDTSWAHSFGRMRGFPSIWMGSVVDYDQQCIDNYRQIEANYPEVAGMDYRPLYNNAMHTLTNGVLEVADDGKTARASYLTPGLLYSFLNDDQKPWGRVQPGGNDVSQPEKQRAAAPKSNAVQPGRPWPAAYGVQPYSAGSEHLSASAAIPHDE